MDSSERRKKKRSQARRRKREAPIRELRALIAKRLESLCADLEFKPSQQDRARYVDDVLELTDPGRYRGIDAVVPAHRHDLIDLWLRLRINGVAEDAADREQLARQLAPVPGPEYNEAPRNGPSYNQVLQAYRARHRSEADRRKSE